VYDDTFRLSLFFTTQIMSKGQRFLVITGLDTIWFWFDRESGHSIENKAVFSYIVTVP